MSFATLVLAFVAGILSILSPCVLPLLPMVLSSAAAEHRLAPLALATGLAVSFAVIGAVIASFGFALGIDGDVIRYVAAVALLLAGLVLISPYLQTQFAVAASPVAGWTQNRFGSSFSTSGIGGQFLLGLLLGAIWSPCVGPTLGAATVLASRGENIGGVTLTMLVFGIGAGLPLALLGLLSRQAMIGWREKMMKAGKLGKIVMGALLVAVGISILTGWDKRVETVLVDLSPKWLTELTTRY